MKEKIDALVFCYAVEQKFEHQRIFQAKKDLPLGYDHYVSLKENWDHHNQE